jgi:hypothetical protein
MLLARTARPAALSLGARSLGRAPPRSGKDRGLPAVPGVGVAKNVLLAGPFWAFKAASVKNKTG